MTEDVKDLAMRAARGASPVKAGQSGAKDHKPIKGGYWACTCGKYGLAATFTKAQQEGMAHRPKRGAKCGKLTVGGGTLSCYVAR